VGKNFDEGLYTKYWVSGSAGFNLDPVATISYGAVDATE